MGKIKIPLSHFVLRFKTIAFNRIKNPTTRIHLRLVITSWSGCSLFCWHSARSLCRLLLKVKAATRLSSLNVCYASK